MDKAPESGSAARYTIADHIVGCKRWKQRCVINSYHPRLHVSYSDVAGTRRNGHSRLLIVGPGHLYHHTPG